MGRKRLEITEAELPQLEKLAAVLTVEQIADFFGMSRRTLFQRMKEDEDVADAYRKGRAMAINDVAESLLNKAKNGDTASMCFFLKCQAGWREKDTIEQLDPREVAEQIQGHLAEMRGSVGPAE